jgi:hypothetical protein
MKKLFIFILLIGLISCTQKPVTVDNGTNNRTLSYSVTNTLPPVNVGTSANDHTGEPLRSAFQKYNVLNDTVNKLNTVIGSSVTPTQFGYLSDVTSPIGAALNGKQATLVSGTNIKYINGVSLLGAGNMVIGSGGSMVYPATGISVSTGTGWSTSITDNSANWNIAYTDRNKWDGGATGLTASTGRVSLGGTTVGISLFLLTNPSAIAFLRVNADNTVTALSASAFKTALSFTSTDVGLNYVTNESKATMFTNPVFSGTYAKIGTDTLATRPYARSVGGGTGNATAVNARVDSIVAALKDTISLQDIIGSIDTLASNPSAGNIYINTGDKKLHYKVGNYWHRVAIIDSTIVTPTTSSLLTGLLAGWKLDETSGNAVDVLGVYTGTSSNITYNASGNIGRCYQFNSTSSTVSFGNVIKPTTAMSISAWVKTSETTKNTPIVDCIGFATNFEGYNLIVYNDGGIGFFLGSNTATYLDKTYKPFAINDNTWHHVVAKWDGTTAYIYVDNSKSTGTSYSTPIVYNASNLLYLGYNAKNTVFANGNIDDVYVWSKSLTDAEVIISATTYPW